MLTLIALSAVLMQESPAPPAPPEAHARVIVLESPAPGSLDKDGDGQVSREEFTAPMNEHFARMDRDGDGRLSTDERSAGHGDGGDVIFFRSGPAGESGAPHFEMRPAHPGGEEREIILRGAGGHGMSHRVHGPDHAGPDGDSRIEIRHLGGEGHADMDKDGDGKISEGEFTGPLREAFTRMDTDRSGFIEEGERGGDGDVQVFTHRIETRAED